MKLILATRNQGKVRELTNMLYGEANSKQQIEVISLENYPDAPEVIEDGKTYAENAIKKASVIAAYTSHLTLADDAGLEVDALDGAPGIHSKRWAGENATDETRIAKLLQALEGAANRRARFIAAIAVVHPNANPEVVLGVCEGHIRHDPVGESGFGYDPVFVPDGYHQTFAELGEEIKNRISHRAKALEQAIALL
ncbi:RdgB/HAM1 family non-canonical purine NTP pyrophosphatase [Candidatus Poribacteria bacterium]|nr:RdgB/HAM1 family non-canonical purine NTP pyrophosphatase [Candidatus Poribacteria bacterium]MXV85660.1 RdgB/HAM1 family non-canonical purine NTP pyrophosphatase [Candidatus Poribacteria bacterium]MYA57144.1 RdgB/HAM1 family non-canonical purine NTP pyrophosphatase [Candidatus Poribacteria bacterium]